MKIRSDYVSNSSSSSFMVVGHAFDGGDLEKIAEYNKLVSEYHDTPEDYSQWSNWEIVEAQTPGLMI